MSLPRFPPTNCAVEADQVSSAHELSGRDSARQPENSPTDTLSVAGVSQVATPNYMYYRIYAEDGAIPSKTPVAPGDPFLRRIKVGSVPPPHTAKTVKRCIAKLENIKDRGSTSLFLTSYSKLPMDDAEKVTILNGTGPGSTPQEPLALVAKMSDSERNDLESAGETNAAEPAAPPGIRYVYYQIYADDSVIPSKVANDPEEPSIGRIRADCIAPPHSPTSIKLCISRVEGNRALSYSDFFADTSCETPLTEGYISFLRTDGPGLSPNEPMAIVRVEITSIPDGKYLVKNRAVEIYWSAGNNPITTVYFDTTTMEHVKTYSKSESDSESPYQWDITRDAHGNISMTSPFAPSSWIGAELKGSAVPVPWRLIPADGQSYYLTTDVNRVSLNPKVPVALGIRGDYGTMATLKEGDQLQMWEFIRI